MNFTLATPSVRAEPFELTTLDWRNTCGRTEPTHLIRVRRFETEAARDAALEQCTPAAGAQPSLASAQEALRWRLNAQRERLQQQLAQVEYNLEQLDSMYAALRPLSEQFAERRMELLQQFVALRHRPGYFVCGALRVTNDYCNAGPSLFVFTLPEYDPVIQCFTEQCCTMLLDVMTLAGYEMAEHWNGPGHTTWSVRVTSKTARAAARPAEETV